MGKSLIHDPERAPLVRRAFDQYATGRHTKEQLLKQARACAITACCTGTVETKTGGVVLAARRPAPDTCNRSDVLQRRHDSRPWRRHYDIVDVTIVDLTLRGFHGAERRLLELCAGRRFWPCREWLWFVRSAKLIPVISTAEHRSCIAGGSIPA